MRQLHHWAALLFVAAIVVHLLRIFFTGAFRRPRETNWIIGVVMLVLALLMGVTGYSLPDDLLSGTGLRIISAILLSVPVIGTWAHFAVFNGDYVGEQIIGRFYIVHVLLIPAILLALIGLHLLILVKQKHTQFPGAGPHRAQRRRQPALPDVRRQGDRPGLRGLRGLRPARRARPDQPDLAVGPVQPGAGLGGAPSRTGTSGSSTARPRLFPPWDINLPGDYTIPALFWPTVVIAGAMFTVLALYPIIERKLTKDTASHHLLQRPRDVPVRTSLGAMALSFYLWLLDVRRQRRHRRQVRHQPQRDDVGRAGSASIVLPPIVYWLTYRICLGLQQHDREVLEHGIETGVIRRLPSGEFIEVHQPLGPVDAHGHGELAYGGAPVPKKMNHVGGARRAIRGFFTPVEEPVAGRARAARGGPWSRRRRERPRAHVLRPSGRGPTRPPQEPRD